MFGCLTGKPIIAAIGHNSYKMHLTRAAYSVRLSLRPHYDICPRGQFAMGKRGNPASWLKWNGHIHRANLSAGKRHKMHFYGGDHTVPPGSLAVRYVFCVVIVSFFVCSVYGVCSSGVVSGIFRKNFLCGQRTVL